MARFSRRQFSFTNGEVSPRLHGRADMEFYYAGLAECVNFIPDHKGNLVRRPPTRLVTTSKDGQKPCLYSFNVGRDCPVIVEAYPDCFRFIIAREVVTDGGAPLEIPHTYGEDYCDLETSQDCGALFIAHENHPPATLTKEDDTFSLEPFESLPFDELNQDGTCRICLGAGGSAAGGSPTIQTTESLSVGDVLLTSDGVTITVEAVNGAGSYTVSGAIETTTYTIVEVNGDPLLTDPDGIPGNGDETDESFTVEAQGGLALLTGQGCAPFTAEWVGRNIRILDEDGAEDGNEPNTWITVRVDSFNSDGQVVVEYSGPEVKCTDLFQAPAFLDGKYPETVQVAFGRLWLARENCVWGSQSGNFFGWQPTDELGNVNPDNAIFRKITTGECNDIRWMRTMGRQLLIGTSSQLVSLFGSGASGAFQSDAVVEQDNEEEGTSDIEPVKISGGVYFVDRSKTKILGAGFSGQYDQVSTDELTIYADHIGDRRFKRIAFQRHPYSVLWGAMEDGGLVSCTTLPGQSVRGWARHPLGGSLIVDGCCTDPEICDITEAYGPDEETDDIYLTVKRTVNGSDVFFIEVIGDYYDNTSHWWEYGHLDAYLPLGNIFPSGVSLAGGPSPSTPPPGVTGNFAAYDGQEWIEYTRQDGQIQAVAPNTTKPPVAGRDWVYDAVTCEWSKHEKPNPCEEAKKVPHGTMVFRAPCGVQRIAECVTSISGLDDFNGEWVSVYADGRQSVVQVEGGGVDQGGCVVRVGFEYESRATLLPHRTQLGSTDGANDPQRPVEIAAYLMDAVLVEVGNSAPSCVGEERDWERINFPVKEIDRPVPFTGWANAYKASSYNDNDESNVSIRAIGPWPCIIRNIEAITEAHGGR